MKSLTAIKRASLALVALSAMGVSHSVLAAGTTSGTTISNTATVNYSVGSVTQTAVTSNPSSFVVDTKVDLTVSGGLTTTTVPGATGVAVKFTVTNTGNKSDTFNLTAANVTSGDNFDVTIAGIYADTNNNGTYDAGTDTAMTSVTLNADATATVFVVAATPSTASNMQTANVTLTATTTQTASTGADGALTVEVVFADSGNNGTETATDTYAISTANLSVTKTSAVVNDGLGLATSTTAPKGAIPGATVRYTITVANSGAQSATSVVLTDAIPTNTTYVAGSMKLGSTVLTDSAADSDGASTTGSPVSSLTVNVGTVAASSSATVTFDVTIK